MEANNIIVAGIVLVLLAALSFILMQVSSKEYPKTEEQSPKFEVGKVSYPHCSDEEAPKKKKKRYYNKKKKPTGANNATTEKRSVGRPRKTT
jgi:hypothetical protein